MLDKVVSFMVSITVATSLLVANALLVVCVYYFIRYIILGKNK